MKKRLLSLALCLALCLGLLPVGVLATEIEPSDNVNNVASVTIGENVTYYTDLAKAIAHADGGTVKLLNNVPLSECIDITYNCTIDLNSKTISGSNSQTLLNICGNVTICDESTQKAGKVINSSNALDLQNGKLTIKGGTFEATYGNALSATSGQLDAELSIEGGTFNSKVDIYGFSSCISGGTFHYLYNANVIADLLKDGCGFQQAHGSWLSANDLGEPYAQDVTVVPAPISGITVKSDKDTYSYGEDVILTANASSDKSTLPTYQWYIIKANTTKEYDMSVTPVYGATNPTCVLTDLAPNYMINGHTYKSYLYYCAATYGDYATGRSVQFTVMKADLKDATIELDNTKFSNDALDENGNLIYALTGSGESIQGVERTQKVIVTLNGKTLTEGTDYTITGNTGTNAGTYTLKIQAVDGSPYYTGSQEKQWSIVPLQLSALSLDQHIKVYDGTIDITAENSVFKDNTTFHTKSEDRLTLTDQDFTILNIKSNFTNPNAYIGGSVTYTVKLHNPNYTFTDSTGTNTDTMTFTQENESIQAAPAPEVTKQGTLTVANRHAGTYTFDLKTLLPELPAPQEYGTTQYELTHETNLNSDYYTEGATISNDGILSLPINRVDNSTEKEIGNIHVKVSSQNFLDFNLTLNVSAANKKVPTGTPTLSKTNLTYGDKLSGITLSGSMKDGEAEVAGTFTWENPNEILTAGKHQAGWIFTPTDSAHYIEVTGESEVTVAKATPTGTPSYTAITESGKTLEDAHLAVGTIQPEGFIQWVDADGKEINVSTEVKANTAYTWKFTPQDEQNYNDLTGTITLWHKSSSGSSSGSVTPGTKTDTVKNPDGSTTKTETKADGSKTETTTASSSGGSTGITVTKTDAKGNTTTEASAKLSDRDVKEAQEKGEAVTVPVKGIAAAKDANAATKIKIDVPNNANKTTVEIPVENVTSGTVAVIVHEDGTEELVKDSKPTEGGVQLELSGSTMVKIIDNSKTFDDTKGHWSQDDVNFVAARDLFQGVGENRFGVSEPMTRGMVNTVLARLADVDTTPGQGQAWYEVGTDWAKKNGISDGTNPTAPVTREQLATLLYRYAGSPSVSGTLHAADAASVSDYAKDALLWANQNGIVNGVGSNTIAPKDNAQRAQVAAMLARYLQNQ